jgi:hypothetical protein
MGRFAITRGDELVAVYSDEAQALGALDSYGPGCTVAEYHEAPTVPKADPAAHQAEDTAPPLDPGQDDVEDNDDDGQDEDDVEDNDRDE